MKFPHLTTRRIGTVLLALLLACLLDTSSQANDARRSPLVVALEKARTSVVNIHSEKTAYGTDTVFSTGKGRKVNGMGTGIVVDERGYIVTNFHVVDGVDSLRVTLPSAQRPPGGKPAIGGTYMARVVTFDRKHDLAIIKIEPAQPLTVMPMGTSSDLMLGETVIAVGNAFGYENSVTSGIVSWLSRDVEVNEKQAYKNLIQTDAAINPGNSGGPLINMAGEVIGINVAIRAGAQRIGFAIPIDQARMVISQLMSIRRLGGVWHGLATTDVKTGKRRVLVVKAAVPNSPAVKAGFKPGDVIVRVAGRPIVDAADLERNLLGRKAGEKVPVSVMRNNETRKISLMLERLNAAALSKSQQRQLNIAGTSRNTSRTSAAARTWRVLGIRVSRLANADRVLAGSRYRGGMRISAVRPGSPAATNGIRPGDVLVGLHVWETINFDNVSYVLDHPQFEKFAPLKFYILRGRDTLYGFLRVASAGR